nr:AraC family transcriptional regulator [uncultured Draconibacterium sp.]
MNVSQFPEQRVIDCLRNVRNDKKNELEWPNVLVTSSEKKYEKSVPESSFSIFTNKKGTVNLRTKNRELRVCEQTFYVCNPFESFSYGIDSVEEVETFNIHLNYQFYTKALYAFLNSNEKLLDKPFDHYSEYRFINQLHFRTSSINYLFNSYKQNEEETFFTEILMKCLLLDYKERSRILKIPVRKESTKKELARRMTIVKDYIYSNYNDPELSVKKLSSLVSMSHFHFLRTFKKVYGISPYQYIKGVRIEKAKYLICKTNLTISEISDLTGFHESNSIYPILKKNLSETPQKYREEISNFQ